MKVTIQKSRTHTVPVTHVTHGLSVFRHATHYQRTHLRTVHAAAIEEPQIAESDESWDKDEAYRRFEALLDQHSVTFTAGDKVRGTVFRVDQKGAYVDVGGKSSAFCPLAELSLAQLSRPTQVVGPGVVRDFVITRDESSGIVVLSLKRIELQLAWARLRQMMEEDITVKAKVSGVNRGGLLVEVENIRGFCPGSQLGMRVASFEELLDREMDFKIMEASEQTGKLMLSNKRAASAEAAAGFNVGDVVQGTVVSVKPYGAFVDLGNGASGLLHISQISHDRILNVEKVVAEGDKIKVMVLSQDKERGRVALCTKKLEPTPGDMLRDPALVYEKAEEMAKLFKERIAAAEAAAREGASDVTPAPAAPATESTSEASAE